MTSQFAVVSMALRCDCLMTQLLHDYHQVLWRLWAHCTLKRLDFNLEKSSCVELSFILLRLHVQELACKYVTKWKQPNCSFLRIQSRQRLYATLLYLYSFGFVVYEARAVWRLLDKSALSGSAFDACPVSTKLVQYLYNTVAKTAFLKASNLQWINSCAIGSFCNLFRFSRQILKLLYFTKSYCRDKGV